MQLTDFELAELQRRASGRTERADSARRARLILLLADGLTWADIRAKLDCSDSYIDRWSKRFAADRLAGLFARHAGRERYKVTDRIEARVLARTTKHKPADGSTHWSTRKLAAELGGDISHMTVARIWAKHGIKPHRLEGYLASNDPDFVAFLTDIVANQPRGKEIHVIADNLSAHKTKQVDAFLAEHSQVHMHFTPTYSSWLNQVELWFAKIERDVIARGVFTSVLDLKRKLMRYIRKYNEQPKPVKWKYFDPTRRITPDSIVTGH